MNRLDELLLLWQDQSIGEAELAELKTHLADEAGRARIAQEFFFTGMLAETLQAEKAIGAASGAWQDTTTPVKSAPSIIASRFLVAASGLLLLSVVGGVVWLNVRMPHPAEPSSAAFGQFETVQGEAYVVADQHRLPAHRGQVLSAGQGIATEGANSEAVVSMRDSLRLKLGGDTLVFAESDSGDRHEAASKIVLRQGELLVEATRSLKRNRMRVQTPLGTATAESDEAALHVSEAAGVIVVRGEIHFVHQETGKALHLSSGQYVATTPAGDVYASEFFSGNGNVWTTFPKSGLETTSLGYGVAFSPQGTLATVSRTAEGGVRLGTIHGEQRGLSGERCVQFSPDGKTLATAEKANIHIHDAATLARVQTLEGQERRSRVQCLAFSPDGKYLAVGRGGSRGAGTVELWALSTGMLQRSWQNHSADVTSLAISPNGQWLASGSLDRTVALRKLSDEEMPAQVIDAPALPVWSLSFSPNGKTLAIATGPKDFRLREAGMALLWDMHTQNVRQSLGGHTRAITSVVFSTNGQTLITGSADTTVRFWDLAAGREYGMFKGHKAAPGFEAIALALSPDGTCLVTASFDRMVKIWETTWIRDHSATAFLSWPRGDVP